MGAVVMTLDEAKRIVAEAWQWRDSTRHPNPWLVVAAALALGHLTTTQADEVQRLERMLTEAGA